MRAAGQPPRERDPEAGGVPWDARCDVPPGIVLDEVPDAIPLALVRLPRGPGPGGRGVFVVDDGGGRVAGPPPREARAPRQVQVLVVRDEVRVEEAHLREDLPTIQGGSRGRTEDIRGFVERAAVPRVPPAVEPAPVPRDADPRGVDHGRTVHEDELGRYDPDPRVRRRSHEFREPVRFHLRVVVQRDDERALGVPEGDLDPRVRAPGEVEVLREREVRRLRELVPDDLPRPVRAPVVDDDHPEVGVRLRERGPDAVPDVRPPVPIQHDDARAAGHEPSP